jgi:hypothetical protein
VAGNSITRDDATKALLNSGYLLESRLEQVLVARGYYVDANDAYPDPATGKSRELDLMAITARGLSREYDFVFNVLLIECVNNPQPLVLLTKKPQVGFLFHEDVRLAGLPAKLFDQRSGRWTKLQEAIHLEKFHHYCTGRVATQFCSFARKKAGGEWMALHEGPHFDSFAKLCDAVDYFQHKHFTSWRFSDKEAVNVEFYYPVLVVQGDLLEGRIQKRGIALREASHLQFRRTAIRTSEATKYHIDVVQEKRFPRFVAMLESELEVTVNRLKTRRRLVRDSVSRIVLKARRLRSPEAVRKVMEVVP